jgi:hypothetical protein
MIRTQIMVRNQQRTDIERAALCHSTYEIAEYHYRQGLMSDLEFRWFKFFWTWSEVRLGGIAGHKHNRAWDRLGTSIYHKRIAKVRRLHARIVYNEQKRWEEQLLK